MISIKHLFGRQRVFSPANEAGRPLVRPQSQPINLAVVTNSDTFDPEDTLFPVIAEMAKHPQINKIAIIDRKDNPDYFDSFSGDPNTLKVRYANEDFSLDVFKRTQTELASATDFNAGWSRFDPPTGYDLSKFYEQLKQDFPCKWYNDLDNMIEYGSKLKLCDLQHTLLDVEDTSYIPRCLIVSDAQQIYKYAAEIETDLVLKSEHGSGGREVRKLSEFSSEEEVDDFIKTVGGTVLAQQFIAMDQAFDDRLFMIADPDTGTVMVKGGMRRIAAEGEWKSNLSQGGDKEAVVLDDRHDNLGEVVGEFLRDKSILFEAVDVMQDDNDLDTSGRPKLKIAEINVKNVGGLVELNQVEGLNLTPILARGLITSISKDLSPSLPARELKADQLTI